MNILIVLSINCFIFLTLSFSNLLYPQQSPYAEVHKQLTYVRKDKSRGRSIKSFSHQQGHCLSPGPIYCHPVLPSLHNGSSCSNCMF